MPMKLPAHCRYAAKAPTRRSIVEKIEDGEIACCRSDQQLWFRQRDECQPLCRVAGDEVYRFSYMRGFGEHAIICIARRGDGFIVDAAYYADIYNEAEPFEASLLVSDWRRLEDALIAANFWS